MTIDVEKLRLHLGFFEDDETIILYEDSPITKAARAYLASQSKPTDVDDTDVADMSERIDNKQITTRESKPADGVEGDAEEAQKWLDRVMRGNLYWQDTDFAHADTIRHALQSTAKLRAQVDQLREALIMSDRMLKAWKKAHGVDPHTEFALMNNKSALAGLGE